MDNRKLIIVSNRLPFSVTNGPEGIRVQQASGGLISAMISFLETLEPGTFNSICWAGVPDITQKQWKAAEKKIEQENIKYVPVFLDKNVKDGHYNGFSNSTLWPLFHYFPSYAEYDLKTYSHYREANQAFADEILKIIEPGDVIWVHDYHLLHLPQMIRDQVEDITTGFFLHIPFPAFDIFTLLPSRWRKELLLGILGSDLVGFHTQDDVIHFLECVQRLTGYTHTQGRLTVQDRHIQVGAFPISIDFNKFNDAAADPEIIKLRDEIKSGQNAEKIIFSVDRLDYTKGLMNRLEAYASFLEENPEYHGKVTFILNVVPSRDVISKYSERKKMVDELVGDLNSRMGNLNWQPVIYQYKHLTFEELMALYTACDIALITPVRDGMNLVAKEFIASRIEEKGVLILSELAGSARELTGSLFINPNDREKISDQLKRALTMPEDEQSERLKFMRDYLKEHDVKYWSSRFFKDLTQIKSLQEDYKPRFLTPEDYKNISRSYNRSGNRLLMLDYDGTLSPLVSHPDMAIPDEGLIHLLEELSSEEHNTVFVISGRKKSNLENWLNIRTLGLVAEHGAFIRWPGNSEWVQFAGPSFGWKNEARRIMEQFSAVYPGSFYEEKEFALAWHYRNVEPNLARRASRELFHQLFSFSPKPAVEVISGHKVIEIRSRGANKGAAFTEISAGVHYDFVLGIGDDRTDEDLFARLNKPNHWSIKVGAQGSIARFNLNGPQEVLRFLSSLKGQIPAMQDQ